MVPTGDIRVTIMHKDIALIRLLQLVSPSLPTGSFSYSQGLEWAVDAGWVEDGPTLCSWIEDIMHQSLGRVDLPLLLFMHKACSQNNLKELEQLCDLLLACRESEELQQEEQNRGRAMAALLRGLEMLPAAKWSATIERSQLAGFALAASCWGIHAEMAGTGYLWAWLENQILTGMKIIPLGQTQGQQLLNKLASGIPPILEKGYRLPLDQVGASSPGLALASSFHETQYTRIYRS